VRYPACSVAAAVLIGTGSFAAGTDEAAIAAPKGSQLVFELFADGGPTWSTDDGSEVVGEVVAKADAPEPGAIQWLLLRVKSHQGSGPLSGVAYIRRSDTKGGAAPKTGCDAHHLSEQARMRYSATYQFFNMTN